MKLDVEDQRALEQAETHKVRRSNLRLAAIGISAGAVLSFSRDELSTATVVENDKVRFEGEIMSLSASALKVLPRLGSNMQAASGPDYLMYEGKAPDEIRVAKEAQNEAAAPES